MVRFIAGFVAGFAIDAGLGLLFHAGLPVAVGLAVFGGLWGGTMAALGAYKLLPLPILGMLLDLSWSLPNTLVGVVWLVVCLIRGTVQGPTADSSRSGTLVIAGAALPGAGASTLGNVIGGVWYAHEEVHVWQARLFGPLYWPVYLLSYAFNMLSRLVTGRFHDPHWESYGRDVMEDWAEQACPVAGAGGPSRDVNWGWWLLGLLCAAFYAACILLAAAGVGLLGVGRALPVLDHGMVGLVIGLALMLAFAAVRSFLPRTA